LTFEGGGVGRLGKKIPCSRRRKGKKIMHGKLRGKKYHAWIVQQKKFLQISHRHFSMGWLIGANPCP